MPTGCRSTAEDHGRLATPFGQIDGVWANRSQGVGRGKRYLEARKPVPPSADCDINSFLKLIRDTGHRSYVSRVTCHVSLLGCVKPEGGDP
jgi:hypothetical protein